MGYSNKLSPLFKEYIIQLEQSNEAVEWQSSDPSKFAYKLREALHAYNNDELKAKFIIKVLPGKVRATPRFRNQTALEIAKDKLPKMVISDVSDLYEIVGAVIKHKSTNRELYFPNAELDADGDNSELHKLWLWCSANGYYMVVGEGITLTIDDPGMAAWRPI